MFGPWRSRILTSIHSLPFKQLLSSSSSPKLIIFDKDGTLVDFDKPWLAWCSRLQTQLANMTASAVNSDVNNLLIDMGVNLENEKIKLGAFAENSFVELQRDLIQTYHSSLERIINDQYIFPSIIESCREDGDADCLLTDVPQLFSQLKDNGYSIAIATADTDDGVEMFLENAKADVDFVLCANTPDFPPKPSKVSAEKLCQHFGVHPDDVVMVGDTPTDMQFGINGNFGLVVGVTTGIGEEADLKQAGAHVVLGDLSQLLPSLKNTHYGSISQ